MNIVELNKILLVELEQLDTSIAIQIKNYREVGLQTLLDIIMGHGLIVDDIEYTGEYNNDIVITASPRSKQ